MDKIMNNLDVILAVLGAALLIFVAVARKTKTTKDDKIAEQALEVYGNLLGSVEDKLPERKWYPGMQKSAEAEAPKELVQEAPKSKLVVKIKHPSSRDPE